MKWITLAALLCLGMSTLVQAEEEPDPGRETIEVKRAKHDKRKHQSLRFLRDNRDYLRSQFDLLRTEIGYERDGDAELIDDRLLRLQEMSTAIATARDTIAVELTRTTERDLLMSVEELAALEAQLNLFDQLLVDQQSRLLTLEEDFLGQQRTALVIVVRGVPESGPPTAVLLQEDQTTLRVELDAAESAALAQGATAQIYHEFVEPRMHRLALRLEGADYASTEAAWIDLETPRDRLTFLELDLATLNPEDPTSAPATQVWQR